MEYQYRRYRIRDGEMDSWVDAWRTNVVPLRKSAGFEVISAWVIEDTNEFAWIIGYDGADGLEAADRAYYESPQRANMDPDPRRFLEDVFHSPARREH